ncbi:triose-phosphate transporter family-domain-containing protein [Russula vinacea]|nr:triose-phosphate transporter family-domain-containing protein [Russula vinacea]
MSPQFPAHSTTNLSFYCPRPACFIGDSFLRFSKTPTASPPVDPLYTTRSRPKATTGNHSKARHDFLPLPVLSSSSRPHLGTNLALGLQKRFQHSSALLFGLVRSKVASVSDYQAFWLILYFILNLVLTLYNKVLLVSFPHPYTLTAVHAFFGLAGGASLRLRNVYQPKSLWGPDYVVLVAFSVLYSVNIAVSNASLGLVTVPFHQIVRAATPFFTTLFSWYLFNTHFNRYQISSIVVVVFGVGLSTYGDYYFTAWGFTLTLVGTVLAALKTIMTHKIQQTVPLVTQPKEAQPKSYCIYIPIRPVAKFSALLSRFHRHRLQLHPLDLLTHLSRLALVQCVAYAYLFGEISLVLGRSPHSYSGVLWKIILISGNGIVACALNIVSFEANRRSGALSMGVAANVKQILTVLCAVWFFHLNVTPLNVLGIMLTLLGGGWYTMIEYHAKHGYLCGRNSAH